MRGVELWGFAHAKSLLSRCACAVWRSSVKELTECIKVKAAGEGGRQEREDSAEFVRFFPAFVWAVRDFTLQLELDGRKVTEDEYLENGLKLKPAGITERYANLLAENEAVSEQTCRALLEELSAAMQQKLSAGRYSQPSGYQAYDRDQNRAVEDYRAKPNKGVTAEETLEQFLASKKAEAEAVLKADILLTEAEKHVAVLSALVKSYMDTTHSGNVPCLVDAVMATENEMGVTEALAHYVAEKETRVAFPAAMMELSERHGKSLADALQLFMQLSLKAETVRYQQELMAEEVLDQFLASETAATDAILRADKTLTEAEEEKASTSP
ncbi:Guanylate-binding protein 4 [Chelonia mydas]|uniref:Guanylate-binding protein 4 n=1 Tax=Chelonia mydas TaxID=8469 RepID=M7AU13_CHEMY|nr:Guanylate-binding protein 4 [Chelonia mydas]